MPHPTEVACLNRTGLSPDKPSHPGLETAYAVCSGILSGTAFRYGALGLMLDRVAHYDSFGPGEKVSMNVSSAASESPLEKASIATTPVYPMSRRAFATLA